MTDFMRMKYENPKLKQSEIANQLDYSGSTWQRFWNDIKMLSPYRIQPKNAKKRTKELSNTNFNNNPDRDHDSKRPQLTSNDFVKTDTNTESTNKRTSNTRNNNVLIAGCVQENIESNDKYLDETLHNNKIEMDLAMQIISSVKTVRINTVKDLKEFLNQSSATEAKKENN